MSNTIDEIISDETMDKVDCINYLLTNIIKSIEKLKELGIDVSGDVLSKNEKK